MSKRLALRGIDYKVLNSLANVYFVIFEFALGLFILYLKGSYLYVGVGYALYNISWALLIPFSKFFIVSKRLKTTLFASFLLMSVSLISFYFLELPYIFVSVFLLGFSSSAISASLLYYSGLVGGFEDAKIYADLMFYGLIGDGIGAFIGFLLFVYSQITKEYIFSLKIAFLIYGILSASALFLINKLINTEFYRDVELKLNVETRGEKTLRHTLILLSTSFLGIGQGIVYPMIVPYLVDYFKTTPLVLMLAYAPEGIGWFVSSRVGGKVVNKLSNSRIIAASTLASAAIAFLLPMIKSLVVLSLLWGVEAVGLSIWTIFVQYLIAKKMGPESWGVGFGSLNGAYYTSFALGSIAGSYLFYYFSPLAAFWTGGLIFIITPLPIMMIIG